MRREAEGPTTASVSNRPHCIFSVNRIGVEPTALFFFEPIAPVSDRPHRVGPTVSFFVWGRSHRFRTNRISVEPTALVSNRWRWCRTDHAFFFRLISSVKKQPHRLFWGRSQRRRTERIGVEPTAPFLGGGRSHRWRAAESSWDLCPCRGVGARGSCSRTRLSCFWDDFEMYNYSGRNYKTRIFGSHRLHLI